MGQRPRMLPAALIAGALLVLLLPSPASAVYEDQIGTFDWYKEQLGQVTSAVFAPLKERVVVGTAQNGLAALGTRDGAILWRHTFPDTDALGAIALLDKPALVVTTSGGGKYVRAWDLDGNFKWEAVLVSGLEPGAAPAAALAAPRIGDAAHQSVVVAAAGVLTVLEPRSGNVTWQAELPGATAAALATLAVNDKHVAVTYYTPGASSAQLRAFAVEDGTPAADTAFGSSEPLGLETAASGTCVAVLSADKRSVCSACHASTRLECQELEKLLPGFGAASYLVPAGDDSLAVASASTGVALLAFTVEGARVVRSWPHATAVSAVAKHREGAAHLAVVGSGSAGITLTLVDPVTGETAHTALVAAPEMSHPVYGPASAPLRAFVSSPTPSTTAENAQVLLVWSDEQLQLLSRGTVAWTRDESLASIVRSVFVDLPGDPAAAAASGVDVGAGGFGAAGLLAALRGERLQAWLRYQVLSAMVQLQAATPADRQEMLDLRQRLSDKLLPFRDANGYRKMILALTASGALAALHNGDGRTLWARRSSVGPGAGGTPLLLTWRTFHDLAHAPQVLVLNSGATSAGTATAVDAHSGKEVASFALPFAVQKVVPLHTPLHEDGRVEQSMYLLVGAAPSSGAPPPVRLLPDTPASRARFAQRAASLYFWLLLEEAVEGGDTAHLVGYGLRAGEGGGVPEAVEAWQLRLPGRVLALTARDPTEPMHTHVKVLGDRSVMFRYTNPNLLFVATGTGLGDPRTSRVTAHLVDSVTGALLHRQAHERAGGPVHAVVSENWIVYTLQQLGDMRTQVTVAELYDASERTLSVSALLEDALRGVSTAAGSNTAVSSFALPELKVLSQSFFLQRGVKGLATTRTSQGITTKQILISTDTDQVYAMDKRLLDPRRPLRAKPTPAETEEQLVPYHDTLPHAPSGHATLHRRVSRLRGVLAGPAELESTTLVFAWGADLFYTRLTPARHFDSLEADFSYGLLVMGLLVLAVGTLAAKVYSERAVVKAKWQ